LATWLIFGFCPLDQDFNAQQSVLGRISHGVVAHLRSNVSLHDTLLPSSAEQQNSALSTWFARHGLRADIKHHQPRSVASAAAFGTGTLTFSTSAQAGSIPSRLGTSEVTRQPTQPLRFLSACCFAIFNIKSTRPEHYAGCIRSFTPSAMHKITYR
jgi:hypothetical protein